MAAWKELKNRKFDPKLIVDKIKESRDKRKSGSWPRTFGNDVTRVSFDSFDFQENIAVLCSLVILSEKIPSTLTNEIISDAIFEVAENKSFSHQDVLKAISNQESKYLRKKEERYILFTSLSVLSNNMVPRMSFEGSSLTFGNSVPNSFVAARNTITNSAHKWEKSDEREDYLKVRIATRARSTYEATEKCLNALDFFRGIWNLEYNSKMILIGGSKKRRSVNKITLGPVHTLHRSSGVAASETFWYELDYDSDKMPIDISKDQYKVLSSTKTIRSQMGKIKYSASIKNSLMRFSRVLDHSDHSVAFVKLWSLLEFLTNTLNKSYEFTVKRAAFLHQDRDYHIQVLEHLRDCRNQTVHLDSKESDVDVQIYQLVRYVRQLILFHIFNPFKFRNMEEVGEFLNLSSNIDALKKRHKLYQRGIEFRSKKT